jgi:hypothetical protein
MKKKTDAFALICCMFSQGVLSGWAAEGFRLPLMSTFSFLHTHKAIRNFVNDGGNPFQSCSTPL